MATRLDKTIKRELELDGKFYTVSVSPAGVKVVPKGGRKGHEISWAALLSGEVELRRDLNLSLHMYGALDQTA
ncbi:MAG: hypothetical protein ACXWWN_05240 [Gemmatimonadales bacterium]